MHTYKESKVPNFLFDGESVRVGGEGLVILKVSDSEIDGNWTVHVKCKNVETVYDVNHVDVYERFVGGDIRPCEYGAINAAYYASLQLHNLAVKAGFNEDYDVYRACSSVYSIIWMNLYDYQRRGKLGSFTVDERIAQADKVKTAGWW